MMFAPLVLACASLAQPCDLPTTFPSPIALPFPISITDVTVADFNLDGIPDIAAAGFEFDGGTAYLVLGTGGGSFAEPVELEMSVEPNGILAADFNNDEIPDLATIGTNLAVRLGLGDGTFAAATFKGAGSLPRGLDAGDIDSDGNLDLAIAALNSNQVRIWRGDGDGDFSSPTSHVTGNQPLDLVLADLDDDGDLDVCAANLSSNYVSVFFNDGQGVFGDQVLIDVEDGQGDVAVADLNADGEPDLIATHSLDEPFDEVSVLLGQGNGTFGPPTRFFAGETPSDIIVQDANGDGHLDVFVQNDVPTDVALLLGDGTGTLGPPFRYGTAGSTGGLVVADVTEDGLPDLVVGGVGVDTISISPGLGGGEFVGSRRVGLSKNANTAALADFNNDGLVDIAGVSSAVTVALNIGDDRWVQTSTHAIDGAFSISAGDFDGDGNQDLVAANVSSDDLSILYGLGNGDFEPEIRVVAGDRPTAVVAHDFNSDGRDDMAVVNELDADMLVYLSNGSGFDAPLSYDVSATPDFLIAEDITGDHIADLIVVHDDQGNIRLFEGHPFGAFFELPPVIVAPELANEVDVADVDQDGHADLVILLGDLLYVKRGFGDGTFDTEEVYEFDEFHRSLAAAEFTGDGWPDVVAVKASADEATFLQGVGDGTLEILPEPLPECRLPRSIVRFDVNQDGALDLVTTCNGGPSVSVHLNTCAGCPADHNGDGALNVLDFVDFQLDWQGQDPAADCDANGAFNVLDFVCFQQLFVEGCE